MAQFVLLLNHLSITMCIDRKCLKTDKKKKCQKVRFNDKMNKVFTPSFLPIEEKFKSEEERKCSLWYTIQEMKKMKMKVSMTLHLLNSSGFSTLDTAAMATGQCFRGF